MRKESQNLKSRDKETEVDRTIGKSGFKRERDQDVKIHWHVCGGGGPKKCRDNRVSKMREQRKSSEIWI